MTTPERNDAGPLSALWHTLCDTLRDAENSFLDPARGVFDQRTVAEGYRSLSHVMRYALEIYLESDPAAPRFIPLATPTARILGDNTDTHYTIAVIDGSRDYVVTGRRGDECYLSFTVHGGPDPAAHLGHRTVGDLNHRGITTEPDGSFRITLSRDKPDTGDWIPLTDDASIVITREYYFDKDTSRRPSFSIAATEPPSGQTVFDVDRVAEGLRAASSFVAQTVLAQPQRYVEPNEMAPPFRFTRTMPGWGTPDNVYCRARYELAPDEALVIEGDAGDCVYWGIQLWNSFMQSTDGPAGPVSRNTRTAQLTSEGRFRVVVAHEDPGPGEPDWLPTTGLHTGVVFCRWLLPNHEPVAPTATVVKLAGLHR
ncbi:DUF1214 domain-containing protein [Yinghuangia seranimata]|uniref:DUF1214 domain-containing protein n=1 Tax=Yinghuangia seranimata TaxID=408067 RepID=UPI00248AD056|nr:DUF1214 domain-containing protein [Yinghuangia seranimata]MDI2130647.1 DUF1214 domain-containing protein [Yinghuangia seranimata]